MRRHVRRGARSSFFFGNSRRVLKMCSGRRAICDCVRSVNELNVRLGASRSLALGGGISRSKRMCRKPSVTNLTSGRPVATQEMTNSLRPSGLGPNKSNKRPNGVAVSAHGSGAGGSSVGDGDGASCRIADANCCSSTRDGVGAGSCSTRGVAGEGFGERRRRRTIHDRKGPKADPQVDTFSKY